MPWEMRSEGGACQAQGQDHCQQQGQQFVPVSHSGLLLKNHLRQEIAKILNVFAAKQMKKDSLTNRVDELSGYPDAAEVASWAKECMNWAVASEFIQGTGEGRLDPNGTATRAQVAVILCRYLDDNATGDASKDDPRNQDCTKENFFSSRLRRSPYS